MSGFLSNKSITSPVFLAPLAGTTDLPFRNLVNSFGVGLVVSEIIASKELLSGGNNAIKRSKIGNHVENTSVQISGSNSTIMADCARLCEDNGAKIIDINMGCPAKKVVNGYAGSALMKDLNIAQKIVESVVNAVKVPVTLKTRLGWDHNDLNAPLLCKAAEDLGVEMITLHGRTRCQFFKGNADWKGIRKTVTRTNIPVIANGDIVDIKTALTALNHSKASCIMIGRGVAGTPWLLSEISSSIYGTEAPRIPFGIQLGEMIIGHYEDVLSFYGNKLGVKKFRKHINWYLKPIVKDNCKIRKRAVIEEDPKLIIKMIKFLFENTNFEKKPYEIF